MKYEGLSGSVSIDYWSAEANRYGLKTFRTPRPNPAEQVAIHLPRRAVLDLDDEALQRLYTEARPAAQLYGAAHPPTDPAQMRALFARIGGFDRSEIPR